MAECQKNQTTENFCSKIIKIIEKLENQKISLIAWLIGFFSIVFLRNFLEALSSGENYLSLERYSFYFFHANAFFLFAVLFLILIVYFLTKERVEKITKLALFASFLLLLPPIIDFVFSGVGGAEVRYRTFATAISLPEVFRLFFQYILSGPFGIFFFGQNIYPLSHLTLNFGIRIQFLIIFLGILWYIFLKTKNILKVVLGWFFLYLAGFIFGTFPYLMAVFIGLPPFYSSFFGVSSLNPNFEWNFIIFAFYFVLILVLGVIWFYIYHREKCLALLKNLRFFRTLQLLAMFGLGLYLAKIPFFDLSFFDWLLIVTSVFSLLLYWLSGIGYDDLADQKIDEISNPRRPLVQKKFSREEFRSLNHVLRGASYISAFVVGYSFFLFLFLRSLMAHIYYASPFRLKRFPFLATFLLALAALFTIFGGFLLKSSNSIFDFPLKFGLFVLLAFTFGFMVKDIKDYQGDKKEKIWTLPVIFGLRKGKLIIGSLVALVFLSAPFWFFSYFLILLFPSFLAALLSFWLINREQYSEKPLFLIYFSYGIFFALTIF